jgi:signal transduction histidine kinase
MAAARRVTLSVAPNLPTIVADPARVELVLLNIVSNGIKYSDGARTDSIVEILQTASPGNADEAMCEICVRDNGLGIPETEIPTIFDRFSRAHAHLDGELGNSGTGLGLAIVRDCIQALGGSIRCESVNGRGTMFHITLPRSQHGSTPTGA